MTFQLLINQKHLCFGVHDAMPHGLLCSPQLQINESEWKLKGTAQCLSSCWHEGSDAGDLTALWKVKCGGTEWLMPCRGGLQTDTLTICVLCNFPQYYLVEKCFSSSQPIKKVSWKNMWLVGIFDKHIIRHLYYVVLEK